MARLGSTVTAIPWRHGVLALSLGVWEGELRKITLATGGLATGGFCGFLVIFGYEVNRGISEVEALSRPGVEGLSTLELFLQ